MAAYIGHNFTIRWVATDWLDPDGNELATLIELSRDGGGTWNNLALVLPGARTYTWAVTAPAATLCLLRFSDPADATVSFVSDPFVITTAPAFPAWRRQVSGVGVGVGVGI